MKFISRSALVLLALSIAAFSGVSSADYPKKAIKLIVPYGPGGASDLAARALAGSATPFHEQAMIVQNKTGAAGVTGSNFVVNSKPDGYTLLAARVGSQVGVPAINPGIPYTWDQFTMLGRLELNPFVLVVNPDGKYKSFADIEKAAKAGDEIAYSSAGVGTLLHIAAAVFADSVGADFDKMTHVPFKGGAKAAAAVMGGQVDLSFQNLSSVIGPIQAGKLVPLMVTTEERFKAIPDVPTASEVGHPQLESIIGWSGLYGPPGLPDDVVAKWVEVLGKVKEDKSWIKLNGKLGNIPAISSPDEMKAFAKQQFETFQRITSKLGMTIK